MVHVITKGSTLVANTTGQQAIMSGKTRSRKTSGSSAKSTSKSISNGPSALRREIPEESDRLLNDLTTGDDTQSESSGTSYKQTTNSNPRSNHDSSVPTFVPPVVWRFITSGHPLTVKVELNVTAWLLFIVALSLRLWRLDYPRNIV